MNRLVPLWALGVSALPLGWAARPKAEAGPPRVSATPAAPRGDSTHPFAPGERLIYEVRFGRFRVGRASLEVTGIDTVRGEPTYHVVFTIRGRALFYSINDTLQSWFSVRDLTSRRFIQDNEENGHHHYHRYEIHPDRGFYVRDDTDTSATTAAPLDDASFLYFARTLALEEGRRYEFTQYFRPERNPVTLQVLGRDTIDTPAGRFATVAIRPAFRSRGLFAEGGRATVWVTDDAARIPVRIQSRISSIGNLSMVLRSRR